MGRIVRCPIENRTLAAADGVLDIFELIAGTANKCLLHSFRFESDEIAAESVRLQLCRRSTTGTGGIGGVEVLNDEDDGAITASVNFDVTSPGTIGALLTAYRWEQLGPIEEIFIPEDRPVVDLNGGRLCLNVVAAFPSDTVISGHIVWEEI